MRLVKYILTFIITPIKHFFFNNFKYSIMTKRSVLINFYVLFLAILFISVGCNNDRGTEKTIPSESAAVPTASVPPPVTAGLTGGILDTLWITAANFKLLNTNKALFIFYFGTNDTVTVHGWKDKGGVDPFSTSPDIRLLKGYADAVLTYGPGTYFGNLVLKNINQLIKKIDDNQASYVLFAPQKTNNHVSYKIFLSKEPHMITPKTMALIPTGDEANPSPPKTY